MTAMKLNADLRRRAVAHTEEIAWVESPMPGVRRRMLDRDGGEVARCTTIVQYAPGSRFSEHEHGGGEEFLVLDGVFSDEHGDYPAGTYVRNPPGSRHSPLSQEGCTILVKLWQMDADDDAHVVIDTTREPWRPGSVDGVQVMPLHSGGKESVRLVRFDPGTRFPHHDHPGGEEVFVLEGGIEDADGRYPKGTWLRCPAGSSHAPTSPEGCFLFVKTGHLG